MMKLLCGPGHLRNASHLQMYHTIHIYIYIILYTYNIRIYIHLCFTEKAINFINSSVYGVHSSVSIVYAAQSIWRLYSQYIHIYLYYT